MRYLFSSELHKNNFSLIFNNVCDITFIFTDVQNAFDHNQSALMFNLL